MDFDIRWDLTVVYGTFNDRLFELKVFLQPKTA